MDLVSEENVQASKKTCHTLRLVRYADISG
jgi:hypothetical protein